MKPLENKSFIVINESRIAFRHGARHETRQPAILDFARNILLGFHEKIAGNEDDSLVRPATGRWREL